MTACRPDPQRRSICRPGTGTPRPASRAAIRPMAGFSPLGLQLPRMTSSTSPSPSPVRSARPRRAVAASSLADSPAKTPPKRPTGVRSGEQMTTSSMPQLCHRRPVEAHRGRPLGGRCPACDDAPPRGTGRGVAAVRSGGSDVRRAVDVAVLRLVRARPEDEGGLREVHAQLLGRRVPELVAGHVVVHADDLALGVAGVAVDGREVRVAALLDAVTDLRVAATEEAGQGAEHHEQRDDPADDRQPLPLGLLRRGRLAEGLRSGAAERRRGPRLLRRPPRLLTRVGLLARVRLLTRVGLTGRLLTGVRLTGRRLLPPARGLTDGLLTRVRLTGRRLLPPARGLTRLAGVLLGWLRAAGTGGAHIDLLISGGRSAMILSHPSSAAPPPPHRRRVRPARGGVMAQSFGLAITLCAAALTASGMTLVAAACALVITEAATTLRSPAIIASKPCRATSSAGSLGPRPIGVSSRSARSKNSVSVGPGISEVTVTAESLSFSSCCTASVSDCTKDLEALYTGWNAPGMVEAIDEGTRIRPEAPPVISTSASFSSAAVETTFSCMISRSSAQSVSTNAPLRPSPALIAAASRGRFVASTRVHSCSMPGGVRRSARTAITSAPSARSCAAAPSSSASSAFTTRS